MNIYNLTDYCTYLRQYIESIKNSSGAKYEPDFAADLDKILKKDYSEKFAFGVTIMDFMGGLTRTLYNSTDEQYFPNWIGGKGGDIDNKQEFIDTLKTVWPEFFE